MKSEVVSQEPMFLCKSWEFLMWCDVVSRIAARRFAKVAVTELKLLLMDIGGTFMAQKCMVWLP